MRSARYRGSLPLLATACYVKSTGHLCSAEPSAGRHLCIVLLQGDV